MGDVLLLVALPPYVLYLVLYLTRSPWRKRPTGKFLLLLFAVIVGLLSQNNLSVWVGAGYFGREHVRIVMYGLVAYGGYAWLWNYLRVRRRGDDPDSDAHELLQLRRYDAGEPPDLSDD